MLHCGWACSQTEPRGSGASIPSQFPPEPRTSECSSLMWVQEYAVASPDESCNAKVSDKAAFFNVVLVLQLFGAVFGEKCEGGGFKRMLNLPLHTDNLHSL